jgi:hypothetical protein
MCTDSFNQLLGGRAPPSICTARSLLRFQFDTRFAAKNFFCLKQYFLESLETHKWRPWTSSSCELIFPTIHPCFRSRFPVSLISKQAPQLPNPHTHTAYMHIVLVSTRDLTKLYISFCFKSHSFLKKVNFTFCALEAKAQHESSKHYSGRAPHFKRTVRMKCDDRWHCNPFITFKSFSS